MLYWRFLLLLKFIRTLLVNTISRIRSPNLNSSLILRLDGAVVFISFRYFELFKVTYFFIEVCYNVTFYQNSAKNLSTSLNFFSCSSRWILTTSSFDQSMSMEIFLFFKHKRDKSGSTFSIVSQISLREQFLTGLFRFPLWFHFLGITLILFIRF